MRVGLVILCCFVGLSSYSQEKDALLWTGLGVKLDVTKDVQISYETQTRFNKNVSTLAQYYNELSLKYNLFKGFDLGGSYRFSQKRRSFNFVNGNRFCVDASYGKRSDLGIKASARARYQYSFNRIGVINDIIFPDTKSLFRIKGKLAYRNDDFKIIQPFLLAEWFTALRPQSQYGTTDAYRFSFGIDLDLPAKHELKLAYINEKEFGSTQSNNHIYVIQYNYAIPGKLFDN